MRPSVESILQSSLLADAVAEEQRRTEARVPRRSAEPERPLPKPVEPAPPSAAELQLREQALRDRETALKEREERMERKNLISTADHAALLELAIDLWFDKTNCFGVIHSL